MTLLAHAIGQASSPAPEIAGLGGRPLRQVLSADQSLGLWATRWDGPAGPLGREEALAHHSVVAAIAAAGPCLPVRFGSWIPDDAAAAALLGERQAALHAALARVAGRSELAVTLLWLDGSAAPDEVPASSGSAVVAATPGRRFLEARRRDLANTDGRRREAERLAERLTGLFGALGIDQADVRHETCPATEVAVSFAALVPSPTAPAVKDAAIALAGTLEGVRGVVSGPWPPYSFTPELPSGGG